MPTVPGPVLRVRMAIADVSESASCCCREGQTRMCKTSTPLRRLQAAAGETDCSCAETAGPRFTTPRIRTTLSCVRYSAGAIALPNFTCTVQTAVRERLRFASAFAVRERNAARVVLHRALISRRELRHYEFAEKSAAHFRFVPSACPAFGVSRKPAVGSVRVCVLADALLTLSLALGGERR